MSDACCRYCTWLGTTDLPELSMQWEPAAFVCLANETVREGWHHCHLFEREPGTDDDLGDGE